MFPPDQYQLLDFGHGRRLERFGTFVLDRPCPAAEGIAPAETAAWQQADARFQRTGPDEGAWSTDRELPERWTIRHGQIRLELKCTPFGHVGVFAEQAGNWDWIARQMAAAAGPLKVLNLFAYTGGSTLAAAAAAEVVHVDSAANTVGWARRNAELSGLAGAPIRWITEDAMKFVRRELSRGNRYDAVILDPPSYGHGPQGQLWRPSKHLARLLSMCGQLTAGRRRFMLLTSHTPKFGPGRLMEMMADVPDGLDELDAGRVSVSELALTTASGRKLQSGVAVRWQAES